MRTTVIYYTNHKFKSCEKFALGWARGHVLLFAASQQNRSVTAIGMDAVITLSLPVTFSVFLTSFCPTRTTKRPSKRNSTVTVLRDIALKQKGGVSEGYSDKRTLS